MQFGAMPAREFSLLIEKAKSFRLISPRMQETMGGSTSKKTGNGKITALNAKNIAGRLQENSISEVIMDNLKIYNAGREVPQEAQKPFNNGSFSGTDINPMWRIKKLTELFGPAGIGWYYEVLSERSENHGDITMAIVDLNLYIKVDGEWSKPIYGTGGNKLVANTKNGPKASDEGYKMALTDALSVACKALGIGADVYFAKDKTKYTAAPAAQEAPKQEAKGETKTYTCSDCHKPIEDYMSGGKVRLTSQDIAMRSMDAYGRTLCMACSKLARMAEAS